MQDFVKGMDISFVPKNEAEGMVIKDFDGAPTDALVLAKKYGVNSIRLRLWNEPRNIPEAGEFCDLPYTIALAKRAKAQGMSFMLDFHYSDWWADPGQQRKPKAWEHLHGAELEEAVYTFTKETLEAMRAEGVLPEYVQIGNEIRSGLIFPDGEVPDYAGMVRLVNAGIRGARAVAGKDEMQLMIHLDQGGRYSLLKEWFEQAFANGLEDFELIGLSYYPFWHGTFSDLKNTMERLIQDYHKPIMVVETAYAWRKSTKGFIDDDQIRIAGVEATPEGQLKVLELVNRIVDSMPDNMGKGIYYWEPLCVPYPDKGGWDENMGLLAADGTVHPGIKAFAYTREQKDEKRLQELMKEVAEATSLAEDMSDITEGEDLLKNTDWNHGLEDWQIEVDEGVSIQLSEMDMDADTVTSEAKERETENDDIVGKEGKVLRVEALKNFKLSITQSVEITDSGKYALKVDLQGTDTTNVDVRLFAVTASGWYHEKVIHPSEHGFTTYGIRDIACAEETLTVGVKIVSPPLHCLIKEFKLVKQK